MPWSLGLQGKGGQTSVSVAEAARRCKAASALGQRGAYLMAPPLAMPMGGDAGRWKGWGKGWGLGEKRKKVGEKEEKGEGVFCVCETRVTV